MNKREEAQQKAKDHLQDLLNVDHGLTDNQIKWIEIFNKKMVAKETFSNREIEIILSIYNDFFNNDMTQAESEAWTELHHGEWGDR